MLSDISETWYNHWYYDLVVQHVKFPLDLLLPSNLTKTDILGLFTQLNVARICK